MASHGRKWPKSKRPWPKLAKKAKTMAETSQKKKDHGRSWPAMAKKAKKPNSGNIRGQNTQPAMAENGQKDKGHGRKWPKRQRPWPKLAKKRNAVAENGQPWPKKPEKTEISRCCCVARGRAPGSASDSEMTGRVHGRVSAFACRGGRAGCGSVGLSRFFKWRSFRFGVYSAVYHS